MRIDVLFFSGCPNHRPMMELLEDVLRELRLVATIEQIEVRDAAEATRLRSFGSPTVQIDGEEMDPAMRGRTDYSTGCRTYGASGLPHRSLVKAALCAKLAAGRRTPEGDARPGGLGRGWS